tara:strand:+ start:18275 stop:18856 length:582 start_codon:yes stop_codon:yes gene_type:complete
MPDVLTTDPANQAMNLFDGKTRFASYFELTPSGFELMTSQPYTEVSESNLPRPKVPPNSVDAVLVNEAESAMRLYCLDIPILPACVINRRHVSLHQLGFRETDESVAPPTVDDRAQNVVDSDQRPGFAFVSISDLFGRHLYGGLFLFNNTITCFDAEWQAPCASSWHDGTNAMTPNARVRQPVDALLLAVPLS